MGWAAKQKFLTEGDGFDWDAQRTRWHKHVAGDVSALADSDGLNCSVLGDLYWLLFG